MEFMVSMTAMRSCLNTSSSQTRRKYSVLWQCSKLVWGVFQTLPEWCNISESTYSSDVAWRWKIILKLWYASHLYRFLSSSKPVWSERPEQVAKRYVIGPATHRESTQLTHTQHDSRSRKEWGRLLKTIPKEGLARWQERCEKCIRIGGSYVEKS